MRKLLALVHVNDDGCLDDETVEMMVRLAHEAGDQDDPIAALESALTVASETPRSQGALTRPYAMTVACPACDRVLPLKGMRPDLTLLFCCPGHSYFGAASWTSKTFWIDPHVDPAWTTDAETRMAFMTMALAVFLRMGTSEDYLILQTPRIDNFVRFTLTSGGDGGLLTEVSSRQWGECPRCAPQPLSTASETVLYDLGFQPCIAGERNYENALLPFDPEVLAAIAETAFLRAFEEPADYGICAITSRTAMTETLFLAYATTSSGAS